jgi:hypothetical protein
MVETSKEKQHTEEPELSVQNPTLSPLRLSSADVCFFFGESFSATPLLGRFVFGVLHQLGAGPNAQPFCR